MMVEDRGKDEFSAQNLMKKHEGLESAVEEYSHMVRALGEIAQQLIAEGHPESENIKVLLLCKIIATIFLAISFKTLKQHYSIHTTWCIHRYVRN